MRYAGLIYDESFHYLDHLGPLCALMGWPLIICEESLAELARRYYPGLTVIQKNLWEVTLPSHTVTCDTRPLIEAAFPGQSTQTLWLPHGNSDKGWKRPFFEALNRETLALVYGPKMIDFMHAKKVYPQTIQIGNFRWRYFLRHRSFYEPLLQAILPAQDYVLYAPTWDDAEGNNSFWRAFPHLARALPPHIHLLVKLHPNTLRRFPAELEVIQGKYARPNITFLTEFPPIYPLLSRCQAYLGDMSSIGYDFLHFDRPLFFLHHDPTLYLCRCGTPINPATFDFQLKDNLSSQRQAAYAYTFQAAPNWEEKIYSVSAGRMKTV